MAKSSSTTGTGSPVKASTALLTGMQTEANSATVWLTIARDWSATMVKALQLDRSSAPESVSSACELLGNCCDSMILSRLCAADHSTSRHF